MLSTDGKHISLAVVSRTPSCFSYHYLHKELRYYQALQVVCSPASSFHKPKRFLRAGRADDADYSSEVSSISCSSPGTKPASSGGRLFFLGVSPLELVSDKNFILFSQF